MPEVNTNTNGSLSKAEWQKRKTFIDAYRQKLITREQFCTLWNALQIVSGIFNPEEGAEC